MLLCRIFLACLLTFVLPILAGAAESEPAKDQQGDALPTGAIAQLGTVRWRHNDSISFVAFLPNGKSVVSVGEDQTIRWWEFPSGKLLRRLDLFAAEELPSDPKYAKTLRAVAMSQDGKILATYFVRRSEPYQRDKEIRLFDLTTTKELPGFPVSPANIDRLALSPNGELLAYIQDGD